MTESKSWGDYFQESMSSVGLSAPAGFFSSSKKACETIGALITFFAKFPAATTLTELAIAVEAGAGAAMVSTASVGALATALGVVAGGVSASFYIGSCIGAVIYATQMKTLGSFNLGSADIKLLLNQSSRHGITVPQKIKSKLIAGHYRKNSIPKTA